LSTPRAAGTYYLVVHSTGGYGNLGRYTLRGTVAAAKTSVMQPAPTPTPTTSQDQGEGEGTATPTTTTAVRLGDDGDSAFTATGAWQRLAGVGYASDTL